MKIRTNFVTNSSSYSSAEIKIENPLLLEILEKYAEQNAFIDQDSGDDRADIMGVTIKKKKMAIYYDEDETADVLYGPDRLEDVIDCILRLIERDGWASFENGNLYNEFTREMKNRSKEINDNFVEVSWEAHNNSYGEFEPEEGEPTEWIFKYHK